MAERQLPVLDAQHEHTAGLLVVGAVNADVKKSGGDVYTTAKLL